MADDTPEPARALAVVRHDGFDAAKFEEAYAARPQLAQLAAQLGRLLPRPKALLADLFFALYKLTRALRPPEALAGSVQLNRRLLEAVTAAPGFEALARHCQLDPEATVAGLSRLVQQLLEVMSRGDRLVASELSEAAQAAEDEDALAGLQPQLAGLAQLPDGALPDPARAQLAAQLAAERARLQGRVARAARDQAKVAADLPLGLDLDLAHRVSALSEAMQALPEGLRQLGLNPGGMDPIQRLELSERLLKSAQLRQLAKLCGAMQELAHSVRRRRLARAPQETHAVELGRDLTRLLPSELLGLLPGAEAARLDLYRRYAEGQLLSYALQAPAERGPMVVCVDSSGSMQGLRELWSKALAITLAQIARREGRACWVIQFSDGQALLELPLVGPQRHLDPAALLALSDHPPGGGTAFEPPLRRALALATAGPLRGADVIFISDGEASVSAPLLDDLNAARRTHQLKIWAVLVDAEGALSADTLDQLSDRLWRVSELAVDGVSALLGAV